MTINIKTKISKKNINLSHFNRRENSFPQFEWFSKEEQNQLDRDWNFATLTKELNDLIVSQWI